MSAGMSSTETEKQLYGVTPESLVCSNYDGLAPAFVDQIMAGLSDCQAAGLDAISYETTRSDRLQRMYYARGRTVFPPYHTVTNASDAQHGWHFFGLADDIISASLGWEAGDDWNHRVGAIMRKRGLAAGQDWPHPDIPHYQYADCHQSPTDETRSLYQQAHDACPGTEEAKHLAGLMDVWLELGAAL